MLKWDNKTNKEELVLAKVIHTIQKKKTGFNGSRFEVDSRTFF
jgi:hypothetical protein